MLFLIALSLTSGEMPSPQVLGWTKDGAHFAYGACDQPPAFTPPDYCTGYYVLSARTGDVVELKDKAAYEAWTKAHPFADGTADGSNHGGKAELVVVAPGADWYHGTFSASAKPTSCNIVRGAEKLACHFTVAAGVIVSWSPDETRLAWISSRQPCDRDASGARCEPVVTAGVERAIGPEIDVAAIDLKDASIDKTMMALEHAGFAPTSTAAAKAARAKSVVYVAKGFDDAGKKIAAAVPGGASVEPLTWKTDYDVVVALGATAK